MAKIITVGDRSYVRTSSLGKGSFCTVYLADDVETGETVVIRELRDTGHNGRNIFQNGIKAHQPVGNSSEHFQGFYGHTDRTTALEYVEGQPLSRCGRHSKEDIVLATAYQLAEGLDEFHTSGRGKIKVEPVHRDIKPDNVLVKPISNGAELVIIDLDLSYLDLDNDPAKGFGTEGYMSPEQIAQEPVTSKSDIYAVGSTLYRIVTGQDPPLIHGDDEPNVPHLGQIDTTSQVGEVISTCWRLNGRSYDSATHMQSEVGNRLRTRGIRPERSHEVLAGLVNGN